MTVSGEMTLFVTVEKWTLSQENLYVSQFASFLSDDVFTIFQGFNNAYTKCLKQQVIENTYVHKC